MRALETVALVTIAPAAFSLAILLVARTIERVILWAYRRTHE